MDKFLKSVVFLLAAICTTAPWAGPTGAADKIVSIRPYQNVVFFEMATANLCSTTVFQLDLAAPGAKELYSALLAAAMAGKNVKLEVVPAGCTGWGSVLLAAIVVI